MIMFFFCQVGDIVSVIDMPPKEDTGWWRGKHGFQVQNAPFGMIRITLTMDCFSTLGKFVFWFFAMIIKRDNRLKVLKRIQ